MKTTTTKTFRSAVPSKELCQKHWIEGGMGQNNLCLKPHRGQVPAASFCFLSLLPYKQDLLSRPSPHTNIWAKLVTVLALFP